MAKGIKVCKVCGREYESCHTLRPNLKSEFRWQDVACCPEHGEEYLRRILISRGELQETPAAEEAAPLQSQQEAEQRESRTRRKKHRADTAQETTE